jgi:glycosyltransferase involved in cell wall biosynthesis
MLSRRLPIFSCYKRAIAQSEFAKNTFPKDVARKAVLVKGGVDTSKFCPSESGKRESKILFVGRIVPDKGIHHLVEAFRLLRSSGHRLVILGRVYDHQYYEDLTRLTYGLPVTFIFKANDETLVNEYQTATVTVLPSLFRELMGQVLLESQACGTPVICSDAGAMHEFVVHGETGFVVRKGNPKAIADALDLLMSMSPKEQADRQDRCREWVKQFDWRRVADKHMEIYREILKA